MRRPNLRTRLILEAPDRVADGAGGYSVTWSERAILWGDIRVSSGREQAGEGITLSTLSYRILVREAAIGDVRRPGPDQRLRAAGRLFQIRAVAEMNDTPGYLVCFATEEITA